MTMSACQLAWELHTSADWITRSPTQPGACRQNTGCAVFVYRVAKIALLGALQRAFSLSEIIFANG